MPFKLILRSASSVGSVSMELAGPADDVESGGASATSRTLTMSNYNSVPWERVKLVKLLA